VTAEVPHARQRSITGSWAAILTLADQVLSSASNFALGVLIARVGGAEALGSFGIAFLIWLAGVGVNRALLTEPMTVGGPTRSGDAQLREGMLASLLVGVAVAGVLAVAGGGLLLAGIDAVAVLALAPWLPSLLVQDYWRAMGFRLQRPDLAFVSDVVFVLVQGGVTVALFALGARNLTAFLAAWGIGALGGALVGQRMARTSMLGGGGVSHLRNLWPRSRWFLAEFGTAFTAGQGYLFLVPVLVGTAGFGIFRAGASLIGPVVTVFLAAGNVALPESARRFREYGPAGLKAYTPRLTAAVTAVTLLYCGTVAILAGPMVRLVYGAGFDGAVLITQLVAVQYMLSGVAFGCGIALKAAGYLKQLWLVRGVGAVVSITGLLVLTRLFGLPGAAYAGIAAAGVYLVAVMLAYQRTVAQASPRPAHAAPTARRSAVPGTEGRHRAADR